MRFRERVLLAEAFDRWAEENNVEKSPLGVITFLDIKEALRKHGDCHPIRCKDCEYFTPMSIYGHGLCDIHCNGVGKPEVVSETYYCAWAEKKE